MMFMEISNATRTGIDAHNLAFGRVDLSNRWEPFDHELHKPTLDTVKRPAHDSAVFHFAVRGKRLFHVVGIGLHVLDGVFAPDNGSNLGLVHDFLIVRTFDGMKSTLEGLEAWTAGFVEKVPLQCLPNRLADVLRLVSAYIVS